MTSAEPTRSLGAALTVLALMTLATPAHAGGRVAITLGPPVTVLNPSPEFIPAPPSTTAPPGGITPALPAPLPPQAVRVAPPVIFPLPDPGSSGRRGSGRH